MSCGTCGIQASNTMQEDTGVPAGAPQTERPRCPDCQAFVSSTGASCRNPRCPSLQPPVAATAADAPQTLQRTRAEAQQWGHALANWPRIGSLAVILSLAAGDRQTTPVEAGAYLGALRALAQQVPGPLTGPVAETGTALPVLPGTLAQATVCAALLDHTQTLAAGFQRRRDMEKRYARYRALAGQARRGIAQSISGGLPTEDLLAVTADLATWARQLAQEIDTDTRGLDNLHGLLQNVQQGAGLLRLADAPHFAWQSLTAARLTPQPMQVRAEHGSWSLQVGAGDRAISIVPQEGAEYVVRQADQERRCACLDEALHQTVALLTADRLEALLPDADTPAAPATVAEGAATLQRLLQGLGFAEVPVEAVGTEEPRRRPGQPDGQGRMEAVPLPGISIMGGGLALFPPGAGEDPSATGWTLEVADAMPGHGRWPDDVSVEAEGVYPYRQALREVLLRVVDNAVGNALSGEYEFRAFQEGERHRRAAGDE